MLEGKGVHIGFTGIDGAGKSTQAALLCKWLRDRGENAIRYEEGRNFVQEITDLLARKHGLVSGREYLGEDLYMIAMSFEILQQKILRIDPYTKSSITIISSRTAFCWLAGTIARQCSQNEFAFVEEIALLGGIPDLTIWLDASPEIAQKRITKRGIDEANTEYLRRYRKAFRIVLKNYPHARINGDNNIETVQLEIQSIVSKFLKEKTQAHLYEG